VSEKRGKAMGRELSGDEVNLTRRRLSRCHFCSADVGKLVEKHVNEPFTMQTPMGSRAARLLTVLVCENCGLVYWWPPPALPPGTKGDRE
jgi:uncharacterized protein with PIN domain